MLEQYNEREAASPLALSCSRGEHSELIGVSSIDGALLILTVRTRCE